VDTTDWAGVATRVGRGSKPRDFDPIHFEAVLSGKRFLLQSVRPPVQSVTCRRRAQEEEMKEHGVWVCGTVRLTRLLSVW